MVLRQSVRLSLFTTKTNCALLHMLDSHLVVKMRKNNISFKVSWEEICDQPSYAPDISVTNLVPR